MLILTRKTDQAIVIGEGEQAITVRIMKNDRGQVRLGIDAPKEVPVHREEIYKKIITEDKAISQRKKVEEAA